MGLLKMLMMAMMVAGFSRNITEPNKWSWLPIKEVAKGQNQNRIKRLGSICPWLCLRGSKGDSHSFHPGLMWGSSLFPYTLSYSRLIPGFRIKDCDWIWRERTRPKVRPRILFILASAGIRGPRELPSNQSTNIHIK